MADFFGFAQDIIIAWLETFPLAKPVFLYYLDALGIQQHFTSPHSHAIGLSTCYLYKMCEGGMQKKLQYLWSFSLIYFQINKYCIFYLFSFPVYQYNQQGGGSFCKELKMAEIWHKSVVCLYCELLLKSMYCILFLKQNILGSFDGIADCPAMSIVFVCWHRHSWP